MKRTILLAIAALPLLSAASVFGCLNDRETVAGEQEFRSRYESVSNPGSATTQNEDHWNAELPSRREWNTGAVATGLAGAALMFVGIMFARRRLRPPGGA